MLTKRRLAGETAIALAVVTGHRDRAHLAAPIHFGHVGHDAYDPRFQAWTIDWVQHQLFHPSWMFDANIFAPNHLTLAYSDSLFGIAIPLLPLRWLGVSPIGQLNIALLLGMATSGRVGLPVRTARAAPWSWRAFAGAAFAFGPFGSVSSGALHATPRGRGRRGRSRMVARDRAAALDDAAPGAPAPNGTGRLVAPAALLRARSSGRPPCRSTRASRRSPW